MYVLEYLNFTIVLYCMIDAEDKNQMKLEELHEVIKWTLKGIGKFFNTVTIPKS